jgi:hypothetical protein
MIVNCGMSSTILSYNILLPRSYFILILVSNSNHHDVVLCVCVVVGQ